MSSRPQPLNSARLGRKLLADLTPRLQEDGEVLREHLRSRYRPTHLAPLLDDDDADVRKVAALSLGMIGGPRCVSPLADRLADEDAMVAQMAEHAMWTIWCRAGTHAANAALARGSAAVADRRLDDAYEHFSTAIALCPRFAEAYNQRGMLDYLRENFDEAADDCRTCVGLMPLHFGAWAGLGHCQAARDHLAGALSAYRRALQINPRLDCVAAMVREICRCDVGVSPDVQCDWAWPDGDEEQ
jgi:tetratricopeptide (TPR) repeat protein